MDHGQRIDPALVNPDIFGPPPDPVPCPFCGTLLSYEDFRNEEGEHICWSAIPAPCTCNGYRRDLERQAAERARQEVEEKQRRIDELYEQLLRETMYGDGLTAARSRCTLDRYVPCSDAQQLALEAMQLYVRDFNVSRQTGNGLLLSGPNGTGKTHLALGCAAELRRSGIHGVMYRTAAEIMREMHAARERRLSEMTVMHAYTTMPLLIIDDLGKQFRSAQAQHWMFEIFDGRYSRKLPVILTTNLAPSTLGSGIGTDGELSAAIVSRLMETVRCIPVTGEDYRAGHPITQVYADKSESA